MDGKFTYYSNYVYYNNKYLLYGASISIAETIIANRSTLMRKVEDLTKTTNLWQQ